MNKAQQHWEKIITKDYREEAFRRADAWKRLRRSKWLAYPWIPGIYAGITALIMGITLAGWILFLSMLYEIQIY